MTTEQLQFLFALFSFVGVIGILFYIILEKAKAEEKSERIEQLEEEVIALKDYLYKREERLENKGEVELESVKEKIIALYEEGADIMLIENALNVPKAKIEMVLKFHNLNKSDNWRESVNNNL
ncbi:MAG: Unknown protein [uncultured Sulfurovum sp.]|uniref:Uncharacterized protein n=1 Tax=uncultured Sulfurovum sp. TaxID=269237 RepID=A0A6S6S8B6_9BACT|nr:MAG: Unknown protein [uncultured Sulfurovum sp.]